MTHFRNNVHVDSCIRCRRRFGRSSCSCNCVEDVSGMVAEWAATSAAASSNNENVLMAIVISIYLPFCDAVIYNYYNY